MKFYTINDNGSVSIEHYKLIAFLAEHGFGIVKFDGGGEILVKNESNILREVNENELITFIKNHLLKIDRLEVLETFTKGVSAYINRKKYCMLPEIQNVFDKDSRNEAWFYFKNVAVKITAKEIEVVKYENLAHKIWRDRILDRDYIKPENSNGQFQDFVFKLAKFDSERFLTLKTALGYLLHRHNNPAICKAIIFNDENMFLDEEANGGTGKSLLALALAHCKQVVIIDGKATKASSRFKNQRIKHTTDIINYDDVAKGFSLEEIFSMLTSGIVIEQKGKQEIHLEAKYAPKVMISSNYVVKGKRGSSDERRRYEFEVANFFGLKKTPELVYGNLFFDEWSIDEWNKFYGFMMSCTQAFLVNGLITPASLNLSMNKLISETSTDFYEFSEQGFIKTGTWVSKSKLLEDFISKFPNQDGISSHLLTKWVKVYAGHNDLFYRDKKTGEKYEFCLKAKTGKEDSNV